MRPADAEDYHAADAAVEALDRLRRIAAETEARRRYGLPVLDAAAALPAWATTYETISARGD